MLSSTLWSDCNLLPCIDVANTAHGWLGAAFKDSLFAKARSVIGLQDMGPKMSRSRLADTTHDKVGRNLAVRQ